MKIIKYPNVKHNCELKFKYKCLCGLKILIEDLSDVVFIRNELGDPVFGYYCPNCNHLNAFGSFRNWCIANKIKANGFDIRTYKEICYDVNFAFEMFPDKTESSRGEMLLNRGLPIPVEMYKRLYNKGEM